MKKKTGRKTIGKIAVLVVVGIFALVSISVSIMAQNWGMTVQENESYRISIDDDGTSSDEVFAIWEGVNAGGGSELFRVQEDGKVGIGTTNPGEKLDVEDVSCQLRLSYSSSYYTTFTTDANGDLSIVPNGDTVGIGGPPDASGPDTPLFIYIPGTATNSVSYGQRTLHVSSNTPTTGFGTGILFQLMDASKADVDDAGAIEAIWSTATAGSEASSLLFKTNSAGATDLETKMLIDKDGYVGIGTTNPQAKVHIDQDDATYAFRVDADDSFFVIDQNGNVGINSQIPDEILDIGPYRIASSTDSQTGSEMIALTGSFWTGSEEIKHRFKLANIASTACNEERRLGIFSDSTEIVTILGEGTVGIGVINPITPLHVVVDHAGGNTNLITFDRTSDNPANGDSYDISFMHENSNNEQANFAEIRLIASDVVDSSEDGALAFWVAQNHGLSEAMRIIAGGNVGIGETSPDTELHVNGDIKQKVTSSNVANPPTNNELDTLFGLPASNGDGWTAYLEDDGTDNFYQIVAEGSEWYIFTATKAA